MINKNYTDSTTEFDDFQYQYRFPINMKCIHLINIMYLDFWFTVTVRLSWSITCNSRAVGCTHVEHELMHTPNCYK